MSLDRPDTKNSHTSKFPFDHCENIGVDQDNLVASADKIIFQKEGISRAIYMYYYFKVKYFYLF
jgi:hypothetical protein